jgi:hypothetical protein
MRHFFSILTAAACLLVIPGAGWAQQDAGIPPMLETQSPLSMPKTQPVPRAPQVNNPKPSPVATEGIKTRKAQHKTLKHKTNVASKKKVTKTAKKKSITAKPRSKVASNR